MSNEEILKLAREAAASKGHTLKDVPERATVEFVEAFAHAVIKAHEAKLIEEFGLYTASQVAAAVAKERAEYQASMDHQNAMARQRKDRIATLESAMKVALEALEETTALCINFESVEEKNGYEFTEAKIVIPMGEAAIEKCKEVLHD